MGCEFDVVSQFVFKCLDYIRAPELVAGRTAMPNDEDTAAIRRSLGGPTELVKTSRISWLWQGRLEDLAAVSHFTEGGVPAMPMLPSQYYTRDEFELGRPTGTAYKDTHWIATKVRRLASLLE